MTRKRLIGSAVLPLLLACGCSSLNHTENGALVGGGVGAGLGALVGHAAGHTAGGALIGGAVGALTGAAIGSSEDRADRRAAEARAMAIGDVVQMTHNHVSDEVIITQIRSSGSVFHLSGSEITWLKQNGVSDPVIMEMQATAYRYPRRYYSAEPVYGEPVYVMEPAPPPVAVGVGFGCRIR